MTTEVESTPAQADMDAGFNEVFGIETPAETPAVETEAPEAIPESPAEPVEERFAGYTKGELDEAIAKARRVDELEKQVRNAAGQNGRLNQQLEALKVARANPSVSEDRLERMAKFIEENFPDVFAGEAEAAPVKPVTEVPVENNASVEQEAERLAQQKAIDDLNAAHPDRAAIRTTSEYAAWLKSLPADERTKFEASWSPIYVSKMLDSFKEWNTKRLSSAKRLEAAVPATTGKGRTTPAIPDFETSKKQGFDSVFPA